MATEQYVDFSATTTVATGGYTAGSFVLNVASTGAPFPANPNFSVVILNASTGATEVLLRVTGVNSSSQWAVIAEGTDANASASDNVYAVLSASALNGIRADVNQFGTRANLPLTTGQVQGNTYKCTDSPYSFIFDGTKWQAFFMGYHVNEPLSSAFSWVNQGGAAIVTTLGGIQLTVPPNSGDSFREQVQSWTPGQQCVDIAFLPSFHYTSAFMQLLLRNSGSTNQAGWSIGSGTQPSFALGGSRFASPTSFNSNYTVTQAEFMGTGPLLWLRIYDDGTTNRTIYFSVDGNQFYQFFQESRTAYITPNQVGFAIDQSVNTSGTRSAMWVVHWNVYSGAPPTSGYTVT